MAEDGSGCVGRRDIDHCAGAEEDLVVNATIQLVGYQIRGGARVEGPCFGG